MCDKQMCDKALDNYYHAIKFVLNCYMTHKMCEKAVNTHPSTIQFVPECYKTQTICDKDVNRCYFYFFIFLIGINFMKFKAEFFLNILFW